MKYITKTSISALIITLLLAGLVFMSYRNYKISVEADRFSIQNSKDIALIADYVNGGITTGDLPPVNLIVQKLNQKK